MKFCAHYARKKIPNTSKFKYLDLTVFRMSELSVAAVVLASVFAGLGWSTLGIWQKFRLGEGVAPNGRKIAKNIIIGVGLGIATYAYTSATGDSAPVIGSTQDFFVAVGLYFPLVVLVDKIIAKTSLNSDYEV